MPLGSAVALMVPVQQLLIGITLGFAARIVFAAVEFAGKLAGLQMGLNLAIFFDPMSGGQATAVSRLFGVTVSWSFIVISGHLLLIAAVVRSFVTFPVSPEPFAFLRATQPQVWGAEIFALGLRIALPLVAMRPFVSLVLGLTSRAAQKMNVFAIGFPITLGVGLVGVLVTAADVSGADDGGAGANDRAFSVAPPRALARQADAGSRCCCGLFDGSLSQSRRAFGSSASTSALSPSCLANSKAVMSWNFSFA